MLIRHEVWQELRGLDERFFLYGEDLDFCLRARQAGWSVVYQPEAMVLHSKGQSSLNGDWRLARYEFHRAMWLFYKKHFAALHPWLQGGVWIGIWGRYLLETFFNWSHRSPSSPSSHVHSRQALLEDPS